MIQHFIHGIYCQICNADGNNLLSKAVTTATEIYKANTIAICLLRTTLERNVHNLIR